MSEKSESFAQPSQSLTDSTVTIAEQSKQSAAMQNLDMKSLTPLMQQYWAIKKFHQDKILLFRMGDFYEMFYDDAVKAAPILNIALTARNKKAEDETPMCGVPHHSIAGPIGKLLAQGLKVAICDQLENPDEAKGIVKRGVTRILSPGMVYEPENISENSANYVAAIDNKTVSFLEASTGECFYYKTSSFSDAIELTELIGVAELLITQEQLSAKPNETSKNPNETTKKSQITTEVINQLQQKNIYHTEFSELEIDWPERFSDAPESAKRLLTYATKMQGAKILSTLRAFEPRSLQKKMSLSQNVLKHLEIFTSYRNDEKGSLFNAIRRTKTSAGARKLKNWLLFPLTDAAKINERLDQVESWTKKPSDLKILRQTLSQMGDIERRLAKVSYANCHVRDLVSLLNSLKIGQLVSPLCTGISEVEINSLNQTVQKISSAIVDDPPLTMKSGGYIRTGFLPELDRLIELAENSQKLLFDLETREKEKTQISSLKIRYNSVFGYYIEVTHAHKDKIPDHYKRKQTLANAERYVTQELHELETQILSSRERRVQLEEKLLEDLRNSVLSQGAVLLNLAERWAELDVYSSLAWLALEQNYTRPQLLEQGSVTLTGSRHPVVEQEFKKTFVPNDISLKSGKCMLLTGPNMAGKSTLMRQVVVTSILAQIGSFVPARKSELPIFKKIFTRIGASDSLSEGLSTFMVEMKETAEMLKSADENTLVVLDEVGRGTSTYDGMSLAQAILEYLISESRCLTLFSTHYHELTRLSEHLPQIQNAHMSVHDDKGQGIKFQYTLRRGPASKSYGIQVAELAGLPASVVRRASQILKTHEGLVSSQLSLPLEDFTESAKWPQEHS